MGRDWMVVIRGTRRDRELLSAGNGPRTHEVRNIRSDLDEFQKIQIALRVLSDRNRRRVTGVRNRRRVTGVRNDLRVHVVIEDSLRSVADEAVKKEVQDVESRIVHPKLVEGKIRNDTDENTVEKLYLCI